MPEFFMFDIKEIQNQPGSSGTVLSFSAPHWSVAALTLMSGLKTQSQILHDILKCMVKMDAVKKKALDISLALYLYYLREVQINKIRELYIFTL